MFAIDFLQLFLIRENRCLCHPESFRFIAHVWHVSAAIVTENTNGFLIKFPRTAPWYVPMCLHINHPRAHTRNKFRGCSRGNDPFKKLIKKPDDDPNAGTNEARGENLIIMPRCFYVLFKFLRRRAPLSGRNWVGTVPLRVNWFVRRRKNYR